MRFVVDGQRFGFHPETEIATREGELGNDVCVCPDCGNESQVSGVGFQVSAKNGADHNASAQALDTAADTSHLKPVLNAAPCSP